MAPTPLTRSQLAAAGMRMRPPRGSMTVQDGWLTIGVVIDPPNARMEIVPRRRATEDHKRQLVALAAKALTHGRGSGWMYRPGVGWTTAVQIRYRASDCSPSSSARCASTAFNTSSSDAGTFRMMSPSRDPSGR